MKMKRDPIVMIVVAVVIAAVGFVAGMQVQKHLSTRTTASAANGFGGTSAGPGGGFRRGGGGTFGQVTSIDGTTSMVVQDSRTGTSVTVSLTGNPTVTDAGATSSLSSIATGDSVVVMGTKASDGTVTATRILLNPSFGGGGSGTAPSTSAQ
jgi:hypothetical protein